MCPYTQALHETGCVCNRACAALARQRDVTAASRATRGNLGEVGGGGDPANNVVAEVI
jgi:hypothetical protein